MWLICANCVELAKALPLAIRDEDGNLEDVKKVPTIGDDVLDCARYGLKSMLSPREKPFAYTLQETLEVIPDMHTKHMTHLQMEKKQKSMTKRSFRLR